MPHRRPLALFALLLLLTLAACSSEKAEKSHAQPPALVATTLARQQDVPIEIKTFGTLEATEMVTVRPMASGELTKVGFREGEDVNQGALLFEIDSRPYLAALNKARATLSRDRVIMENARRDYDRYSQLAKEGIVTQEQADGYRTKAETATADLAADRAAMEDAQAQLSYCTITSPISGRLGSLSVDRGNVVKANDTALVTINKLTPILATFTFPEKDLSLIQARLAAGKVAVEAEVPGTEGLEEQGELSFLDNAVNPATGTIRLKGTFTNSDRRLWPGQYVTLAITLEVRKQAVVVPSQAIQISQNGTFVFVVKADRTAEIRPIVAGPAYEGVTVIDKGLRAGEQVVIDGQMRVVPGGRVEIKGAGKPKAGAGENESEAADR